jgi:hypothetical protein
MAIDYNAKAALVASKIQQYGREVTFLKLDKTVADATKPWRGATDPIGNAEELPVSIVSVDPTSLSSLGNSRKLQEMIKTSREIMMAPATGALEDFDMVQDGIDRFRITGVEKLKPGNVTLLYYVGVE